MRPRDGDLESEIKFCVTTTTKSNALFTPPSRPPPCPLTVDDHHAGHGSRKFFAATYKKMELPPKNTNTDKDDMALRDGGLESEKTFSVLHTPVTPPSRLPPSPLTADVHHAGHGFRGLFAATYKQMELFLRTRTCTTVT